MWYIHTMGYYSALKWNEILIHTITRMIFEDKLSEISQSQKHKNYMIPHIEVLRIVNSWTESKTVVTGGWGLDENRVTI